MPREPQPRRRKLTAREEQLLKEYHDQLTSRRRAEEINKPIELSYRTGGDPHDVTVLVRHLPERITVPSTHLYGTGGECSKLQILGIVAAEARKPGEQPQLRPVERHELPRVISRVAIFNRLHPDRFVL